MGTVLSPGLYSWVWPWVLQSSCHCLKIPNVNCYLDEYNIVVVLLLLNPTVPLRNYPLSWKILKLGMYLDCKQQKPWWKWLKQIGVLSSEKAPRSKQPGLLLASSSAVLQARLLQVGILVTFQAGGREHKTEWASQSQPSLWKSFPRTCTQQFPFTFQWPNWVTWQFLPVKGEGLVFLPLQ